MYSLRDDMRIKLAYPGKKELAFTESTETLTKEKYEAFLAERARYLTVRIVNKLYE